MPENACDNCLARLCVTKDENGRITGIFFANGDDTYTEVPICSTSPNSYCCDGTLPDNLTVVFTGSNGDCNGINGLGFTIERSQSNQNIWELVNYTGTDGISCTVNSITSCTFNCETGMFFIVFGSDNMASGTPTNFTCSPVFSANYELTLTYASEPTCCAGNISVSVYAT